MGGRRGGGGGGGGRVSVEVRRRFQIVEQVQAQRAGLMGFLGFSWVVVVSGCRGEEGGGAVGPTRSLDRDFSPGKNGGKWGFFWYVMRLGKNRNR